MSDERSSCENNQNITVKRISKKYLFVQGYKKYYTRGPIKKEQVGRGIFRVCKKNDTGAEVSNAFLFMVTSLHPSYNETRDSVSLMPMKKVQL